MVFSRFLQSVLETIRYICIESNKCWFSKWRTLNNSTTWSYSCIPKENKSRNYLKIWRPITLLNTVYKIASGSIADRIKQVLDKLISTDQTGFIEGRFIGKNSRLVYDLLQFTEEKHIPGLLLLIDFEKAFDSVSWSFINKVLKFFNFGPSILKFHAFNALLPLILSESMYRTISRQKV